MKLKQIIIMILLLGLCASTLMAQTASANNPVVVRKNVCSFVHPQNRYEAGQEWAPRYYYIRTPDTVRNEEMYRYDLTGYSYGISKPISFTWVGYLYAGYDGILQSYAVDTAGNNISVSQYIGNDGHLYLKFGPISQYYNSFVIDYQSGSTGEQIEHNPQGYTVSVLIRGDVILP